MTEPRDIFVVGGAESDWVRHLAALLAGRGHQVRQVAESEAAGRLTRLLGAARPGGIVIAVDAPGMRLAAQAGPGALKVIGLCTTARQTLPDAGRREIVELFADASRFLALSGEDADAWARDGLTNADVIAAPSAPVTGERRAAGPVPAGPVVEGPVVVGPAVLSHGSGADLLVEAWAQVAGRYPAWRLWLGDSGPEAAAVRRLAETHGVRDSVCFGAEPPAVDGDAGGPVRALPAREESLPTGVQDAMARGLPIVAFDSAPVIREHLTDEVDGLLVSPGNTAQFAIALDRLIGDEGLRRKLGTAARESVRRYEPEVVLARWERLFRLVYR